MSEFINAILQGAEKMGLSFSAETVERFDKYRSFLVLQNERMNLTSIEGNGIAPKSTFWTAWRCSSARS
jgi:16S rRNA G527 N7-methylase RsmG